LLVFARDLNHQRHRESMKRCKAALQKMPDAGREKRFGAFDNSIENRAVCPE